MRGHNPSPKIDLSVRLLVCHKDYPASYVGASLFLSICHFHISKSGTGGYMKVFTIFRESLSSGAVAGIIDIILD